MTNKQNNYAVILAGGSGTRFWPLSRASYPKQFIKIMGNESLLQQTVRRIRPLIPASNVLIVTNRQHLKEIQKQLKAYRIPKANILLEPDGRNTAPAICWAANVIYQRNPEGCCVVLPSDHLIQKQAKFVTVLKKAIQLAQDERLVTFGITPTRPDTGYGYLKTKVLQKDVFKVLKFTEKPKLAVAQKYVKQKNYFWNSGMFIWRADVILKCFAKYQPQIYKLVGVPSSAAAIKRNWSKLPNISVDYAILEKDKDVMAVAARDIGWSDLGSWDSLVDVLSSKRSDNIFQGDVLIHNTQQTFVRSHKKVIACVGVKDLIIVDTNDALLVCAKDASQDVKAIVDQLKKAKRCET